MTENQDKRQYDPGWNDPPLFSYDSRKSIDGKVHLPAKRLSFLSGESPQQAQKPLQEIPSSQNHPAAEEIAELPTSSIPEEHEVGSDLEYSLEAVIENFDQCIEASFKESSCKKAADIRKRLSLMESLWKGNRLLPDVQMRIHKLSEAIKGDKLDEADNQQRGLMVDHPSNCSSWIAGIRSLINAKRNPS